MMSRMQDLEPAGASRAGMVKSKIKQLAYVEAAVGCSFDSGSGRVWAELD